MKTCLDCKKEKLPEEFYVNNASVDKLTIYCKECIKTKEKDRYYNSPVIKVGKSRNNLKKNGTLLRTRYNEMLLEQNNKCGICKDELKIPVIDHNHNTGEVRMILCNGCNTMLGLGKENIQIFKNAINYIEKFNN